MARITVLLAATVLSATALTAFRSSTTPAPLLTDGTPQATAPTCPGVDGGPTAYSYDDLTAIRSAGQCTMAKGTNTVDGAAATLGVQVSTCNDGALYVANEVAQVNGRAQSYDAGAADPWAYVKVAKGQTATAQTADDAGDVGLSKVRSKLGC